MILYIYPLIGRWGYVKLFPFPLNTEEGAYYDCPNKRISFYRTPHEFKDIPKKKLKDIL